MTTGSMWCAEKHWRGEHQRTESQSQDRPHLIEAEAGPGGKKTGAKILHN